MESRLVRWRCQVAGIGCLLLTGPASPPLPATCPGRNPSWHWQRWGLAALTRHPVACKATRATRSGTGRRGNFPNLGWPRVLPTLPQRPRPASGVGAWMPAVRRGLCSGCRAEPPPHPLWCAGRVHCITPGASAPGFAASWAPGGGTLLVFQQALNRFTLPGLPMAAPGSRGRPPACLPACLPDLGTALLLLPRQQLGEG